MRGISLASVAIVAVSACSSGSSSSSSDSIKDNPAVSAYKLGTLDQLKDIKELCPDDKVTIAYADGLTNPFRAAAVAEFEDEAKKCPNITTLHTNAQGDTSRAISDLEGLTARGVDAIITHEDAGKSLLPAIQAATKAGVVVVPLAANVGGKPGTDYLAAVGEASNDEITIMFGELYANWLVKALDGEGNIIHLGGPAGNPFSAGITEGMKKVFADNPGMNVLEEEVTTNYDPAECQKVTASLLTKYKQIDGMLNDYGACTAAALRSFVAAKRPLPAVTGDDQNVFACTWDDLKAGQPDFQIAIGESRPWRTRLALRRALAGVQKVKWDEPTDFAPKLVADTIEGGELEPACDKDLPPDAFTKSSMLSKEQIKAVYK